MTIETCPLSLEDIRIELEALREIAAKNSTKEKLAKAFSCIDLTTLNSTDTINSVAAFTEKVNSFPKAFPRNQQCGSHLCLSQHGRNRKKNVESAGCTCCRRCWRISFVDDFYQPEN